MTHRRSFRVNGILYTFRVSDSVCEYGNFYVSVHNQFGFYACLCTDLSIRGKLVYRGKNYGYFQTEQEAIDAIEDFYQLYGEKNMSTTLNKILADSLDNFIGNDKMFTAYDVTLHIRNSNPDLHVYHDVVKNFVHNKYEVGEMSGYDRTLIDIANPNPWCYYKPGQHDPTTYQGVKASGKVSDIIKATFGGIVVGSH